MPSEQGSAGNKVKKLCIWALLTAVCLITGYIESLLSLAFIAPGVKIGLANSIACVLVFSGDIKGAVAVNLSRILLSALLFGSPVSLAFSLAGGAASLCTMLLLKKVPFFSVIGISALGGVLHNAAQCAVGIAFIGIGAVYYLPVLIFFGMSCGVAVGFLSALILKRMKKG